MAVVAISDSILTDIADAIRSKNGTENTYKPSQMADAIEAISGGGITPTGTKQISITQNGTTTEDVTNYANAEISVNVPTGSTPAINSLSVTENGTYTAPSGVDGYSPITVNVSGGGSGDHLSELCNATLTSYESSEVTKITTGVFRNYTKLASVKLPNLARISGGYAFTKTKLSTVVFPSIISIKDYGNFESCTSLTSVDLGEGLTELKDNAFYGCSNLTVLILRRKTGVSPLGGITVFGNTPFASGKAGGTLYVPSSLISSYQSASNWSTILGYETNSIQAIEGSIYENAYADGTPIS